MDDIMHNLAGRPRPTPARPFLGLTILVVEDSRYASEAMRLLCLRSGARIRRADCIASAKRHLNVYRPSVAIVDLGLPDGSGLDLIAHISALQPRVPVVLGTSGADRDTAAAEAMGAGADGFLPKPLETLAAFQAAILTHLPDTLRPKLPRVAEGGRVTPDLIAYREDLSHAMDLLAQDDLPSGYLRRFLLGVARSAQDGALEDRAKDLPPAKLDPAARLALHQFLSHRVAGLPLAM